jgi:hypothetical protein
MNTLSAALLKAHEMEVAGHKSVSVVTDFQGNCYNLKYKHWWVVLEPGTETPNKTARKSKRTVSHPVTP